MVRQGVGVLVAVVVLAGCGGGGSSDEEQVVETVKRFKSAALGNDGRKLCRELLHPNTVRVVERLARADAPPGGDAETCEETYHADRPRERALEGRPPKASEVTIKGDIAYLPDPDGGKRPLMRRAGDAWKLDFTGRPGAALDGPGELRVRALAAGAPAAAAAHRQPAGHHRVPACPGRRLGEVRARARPAGCARRGHSAGAGHGGGTGSPAVPARGSGGGPPPRRSLEAVTNRARTASSANFRDLVLGAREAKLSCGRNPSVAPDGAEFRRKATAVCEPIHKSINGLGDPGSSPRAAIRFLRRASVLDAARAAGSPT